MKGELTAQLLQSIDDAPDYRDIGQKWWHDLHRLSLSDLSTLYASDAVNGKSSVLYT
jgi:hypothetical protein